MDPAQIVRILVVIFFVSYCNSLQITDEAIYKNVVRCDALSKEPYFDIEQVIGKPWRVYYTWYVRMEAKCMDMTFRNATPMITNRIYHDMYEYLEVQPNWDAATLFVTIGNAKHELLLFADQGPAGSFVGVPNVVKDGNISPTRRAVPLLKFYLKLLHEGKYLLMSDCTIGVTTLSSRERPPYRTEVASVANSLPMDKGDVACASDKKQDEEMYIR